MRAAKTQISLGRCPGWSESLLGTHSFCWFCHVVAQMMTDSLFTIYYCMCLRNENRKLQNFPLTKVNKNFRADSLSADIDLNQLLWGHVFENQVLFTSGNVLISFVYSGWTQKMKYSSLHKRYRIQITGENIRSGKKHINWNSSYPVLVLP